MRIIFRWRLWRRILSGAPSWRSMWPGWGRSGLCWRWRHAAVLGAERPRAAAQRATWRAAAVQHDISHVDGHPVVSGEGDTQTDLARPGPRWQAMVRVRNGLVTVQLAPLLCGCGYGEHQEKSMPGFMSADNGDTCCAAFLVGGFVATLPLLAGLCYLSKIRCGACCTM